MSKALDDLVAAQLMPEPKPDPVKVRRMYAAARPGRFNTGLGSSGDSSADAELNSSLGRLRASSRQIVRDAPYAKRARTLVVNNVIGPGIGMQAQVEFSRAGGMNDRINKAIERAWDDWAYAGYCHTGGALHFCDMERAAMGEVFTAGESFLRVHAAAFGGGEIPLAIEMIEAERLANESTNPGPLISSNAFMKMGIELDGFGRALGFWIRSQHPGDLRTNIQMRDRFERIPADDVYHLRIIDRWPQTRGEPWMHTVIRKLDSIDQYSGAELQAAQADAYHFGTIKSAGVDPSGPLPNNQSQQDTADAAPEMVIENGVVNSLAPGEEMDYHSPTRPNTALDPFLRYMLREVAAGTGVSYESLSRDYSQSNYSSSRLALLDDRDLWRTLQMWWIRNFRLPFHRRWLRAAILAGAIPEISLEAYALDPSRYEAVKFKPRGWSWINPKDEVAAYKEAEKAGYISAEDIIAQTANGMDIEDVVAAMARSKKLYDAAGIERDTDVAEQNELQAAKAAPAPAPPMQEPTQVNIYSPPVTVNQGAINIPKGMVDVRAMIATPEVQNVVNVKAPDVQVHAGDVHMPDVKVSITTPEVQNHVAVTPEINMRAGDVNIPEIKLDAHITTPEVQNHVVVEPATVNVRAGDVNMPENLVGLTVAAPNVTVEAPPAPNVTIVNPKGNQRVFRDKAGNIERIVNE